MSTQAILLKLNKVDTTAMNALTNPKDGEPVINTTTGTIWYYDTDDSLWHDTASSGSTESAAYSTASISAVGSTALALGANDLFKTTKATVTAPAGIYTHALYLQTTNANAGDKYTVVVILPASSIPTIEIRNATSGGTLLQTLNNADAVEALLWSGTFIYTGSAWEMETSGYHES